MSTEHAEAEASKGFAERAKDTVAAAGESAKNAAVDAYHAASESVSNLTKHMTGATHADTAEEKAGEAAAAVQEGGSSVGKSVTSAAEDVKEAVAHHPDVPPSQIRAAKREVESRRQGLSAAVRRIASVVTSVQEARNRRAPGKGQSFVAVVLV